MGHNRRKFALISGSILGLLTVLIGAFGAHGLADTLAATGKLDAFQTGVKYQSMHAIVLLVVGLLLDKSSNKWLGRAALMFVIGVVLFSGSLYVLSLTGMTQLGVITPIGGLFMIIGWVFVLMGVLFADGDSLPK